MSSHRLYVDEVGNHDMKSRFDDPNTRYLTLAGVAMDLRAATKLSRDLCDLKARHFERHHHPDHPVVLHRKDIVQRNRPFDVLKDPARAAAFDEDIVELLRDAQFDVIVVVIDKMKHKGSYAEPDHPYQYCMKVLVERFAKWLEANNGLGDVMAEKRGGNEDKALAAAFARVIGIGTQFVSSRELERVDGTLQFKGKHDNVAGLQIADVIAHPCYRGMLHDRDPSADLPSPYAMRILEALEPKYRRSSRGTVSGYGKVWLP